MRAAIWITLSLVLGGCGFHLRGAMPLPDELKAMQLECPTVKERIFCQSLERQLAANGIDTETSAPNYRLLINDIIVDRRAVSIDERSVASEVQLSLLADFNLISSDGIEILPLTRISAVQSYRNDQNQVLGKGREEQQIRRELSQQLANQITARLAPLSQQRIKTIKEAQRQSPTSPVAEPASDSDS